MTHTTIDKLNTIEDVPLILNFEFTENSFFEFCQLNRDLRIERDEQGTIHIMPPIAIRSPSDNLDKIKKKMQEYMDNGCRLGWLIDRVTEQVFIYRGNGTISLIGSFTQPLSGEDVLPGFELVLAELGT